MKKIITLLMIAFALSFQLKAQVDDAVITPDQIQYWIGEGANSVVFAVNWCNPDTALAWGFRFDGDEVTVQDMMDSIAAHDSRFAYEGDASTVNEITYQDENLSLSLVGYWMYNVNGSLADWGYTDQIISDGDFIKWGDADCAAYTYTDDWPWIFAWDNVIAPVSDPNPVVYEDAVISADDVDFWVGEGENEVVMIINWCAPDTALAWGYRFSKDSLTVETMLKHIAATDPRLDYSIAGGYLTDITFTDSVNSLSIAPDYIMYNHNGGFANAVANEFIYPNDYVKFGGYGCANLDEFYNATWATPIQPVAFINTVDTNVYDGIAGSAGCQGIFCEDPAILGWATDCKVTRGLRDITIPDVWAAYGTDADGIGAATENTGDVVSLGDGGVAILTFDIPIENGDGYDFAVFENGLVDNFLELAFVEVSSDGENYFRFPAVSNTPLTTQITNNGGVDPTHLHNIAGKYRVGWGTPFDLEELAGNDLLDINNVRYVKVIDVVGTIDPTYATFDKNGHIINDPYPTNFEQGGFDLDGVCVLNGWKPSAIASREFAQSHLSVYPNPCHDNIMVETTENEMVTLYDAQGRMLIRQLATSAQTELNLQDVPAGIYFVQCGTRTAKVLKH